MSEFVAGAFVDVAPDTKGFRDKLKTQVNSSIKSAGVFKVPIEFDVKAFKRQLAAEARAAKPKIPVEVGGSIAQLRKDINAKIRKATEGIKIKVPIEIEQTGAGSRGGGGRRLPPAPPTPPGGTGGGTGDAGRARKKLTDEERQAIAVAKALETAEAKLAATESSLAGAMNKNLAVEERAQRLREARTSANAAVRTTTDALARSEGLLTEKQKLSLEVAQREALTRRADVLAKEKEFKLQSAQAVATTKVTAAREATNAAMAIEISEVTTLNELHVVENELLAAEAALKRTTNKARELGLTSLAAENDLLLANIAERKQLIAAQRLELKGEGKRATQQKTGLRGGASSILSLLGLRGATLAASGAFLAGAAAAAVFTKSIRTFADFEAELNTFKAVAGATDEQMKEVSETAKQLGADITLPAVSSADAAVAMTELARAGLDVQNSIEGARGVLQLATAAQISNADAATLVASGLNAFSLEGTQAVHVADLLANAANAAQGSISEMGAALQQAAAISHQVGITLDDTVAILTLFARNGLRGSDAGTSLRTALARLIAPTKIASDVIADLGLNVRDANGNVRPEVFADFAEATRDLTPALRDMLAETIAGQDSIRAFAIGGREGAHGLELARLQMAQTGTAAQIAKARTDGLAGAFSSLSSSAETLGESIGQKLAPPLELIVQDVNDVITVLTKLSEGDFGGIFDFAEAKGKETEQRLRGIKDVMVGLTQTDFGALKSGLGDLFGPVEREKSRVQTTLEQLNALEKIRIEAFDAKANLDIGPITEQIKELRKKLRQEKIDVGLITPVTPLEKATAPLRELRRQAKETRDDLREALKTAGEGEKPGIVAQLEVVDNVISSTTTKIIAKVKNFGKEVEKPLTSLNLAKDFQANFDQIAKNIDLATPEVLGSIDDLIADIRKVPVGTAPQAVGLKIAKGIQTAIDAAIAEDDPELAALLQQKAQKIAALFGGAAAAAFKNLKIPLTADDIANIVLPEQIASLRAEAFGTRAGQLAAKQAELAKLTSALGKVKKGSQDEAQILQDIINVQEEIADLLDDSEAIQKADTAVLESISGKEQVLQNKLAIAETTETLNDDLRAQRRLRAFYIEQVEVVRKTIKDKQERNDAVADLKQKLFELDLDIAESVKARAERIFDDAAERAAETESLQDDLNVANRKVRFWRRQVKILEDLVRERKASIVRLKAARDALDLAEDEARSALRARRQQQRERRQERIELKIQIAQDTGNVKAEIRFREIQIRQTQALIRQTRRGSLQRLRLIAELRREQRELRELRNEKQKGNQAAAEAQFAFLQTIQGFAFNLLSNIIPGGIGGLVGGTSGGGAATPTASAADIFRGPETGPGSAVAPPARALQSVRTSLDAQKERGVTAGQGNVQIKLLREIRNEVRRGNRGMEHPEAKNQRKVGSAAGDNAYQGTHGM